MKKAISFTALAVAGALALAGCAGGGDTDPTTAPTDFPEGSTMAELAEAGTITIGTKFDQPLFGLVGPSGDPVGFDVEIGKIIAAELGISEENIVWTETVSANREPFIESGQVDIVIATYTINDTRKEVVSFAGPYYMAGQATMVLAGDDTITDPSALEGVAVCTASGSTPEANLLEIGADVTALDAYSSCLEPLRNGQVQAVSTDNVILAGYVDQNTNAAGEPEFQMVAGGETFTDEPYGIGLALEDDEFRNWINDVLEAAAADGRYEDAWNSTAGTVLDFVALPTLDRY